MLSEYLLLKFYFSNKMDKMQTTVAYTAVETKKNLNKSSLYKRMSMELCNAKPDSSLRDE